MAVRSLMPSLGAFGSALVGAPWWCVAACVLGFLLLRGLQAVFPQDSADRLEWWKDFRRRREDGQDPDAAPRTAINAGAPAAGSAADPAHKPVSAAGGSRNRAPRDNPSRRRRPSRTSASQPPRAGPL